MMKAFILLCVLAVAFANECGENEHFESCGTACPLTCENYQNPPKACVLRCDIGCHCDKGYVRSADGRCVKPEECPNSAPKQCGENQHYESCGTACPLTCKNYENPPKFCILMCNPGCHCDEGYVKTDDGQCVRPEQCPAHECGKNQHYESCGTFCPLTCKNYGNPPKSCVFMCKTGCYCDDGFLKADDGVCVRPEQCRAHGVPVCGENKHYLECGTACPLTCDNYDNPPRICPAVCVAGCHCQPGFVKTHDNRCVKVEDCPSKASADEELCSLPAKIGMCKGYFRRFFFNQETGKCEAFIYGGCGGNKNNFATEEECHNTCGSS